MLNKLSLNTMAIQGNSKHKCEQDLQVPEPPRRSKPRNNKTNAKHSARNSNSSLNITNNKPNIENDNHSTPDNKSFTDSSSSYDVESKRNSNTAHTSSGRPTAMDLAVASNGGKRSMWGELREVVESGVLGIKYELNRIHFSLIIKNGKYCNDI